MRVGTIDQFKITVGSRPEVQFQSLSEEKTQADIRSLDPCPTMLENK